MERSSTQLPKGNRILDALPRSVTDSIRSEVHERSLRRGTVLFEAHTSPTTVEFPLDGVVSLICTLRNGATVEVGTIGREGIVGVPYVLGRHEPLVGALMLVGGRVLQMSALDFIRALASHPQLRTLVVRYRAALFNQVTQTAACNRLHPNEGRLCRWLLMIHDRVGRDDFAITHDTLAEALGSRRATVTDSMRLLQHGGLVQHRRGRITVIDRAGLEEASCECYGVIARTLQDVLMPDTDEASTGGAPA